MKHFSFILYFIIFSFSCTHFNQEQRQLREFNEPLDPQKIAALDLAIESFDKFLNLNFDSNKTEKEKIIDFLSHYSDTNVAKTWHLPDNLNQEILIAFENSGLRKEVWLYNCENGDSQEEIIEPVEYKSTINLDSILDFNYDGIYLKSLKNIQNPDSSIINYIQAKEIAGNLSVYISTKGFKYGLENYETNLEIWKRIIIIELYYDLIKWKIKNSAHNNG